MNSSKTSKMQLFSARLLPHATHKSCMRIIHITWPIILSALPRPPPPGSHRLSPIPVCSQNVCSQFLCPLTPPSQPAKRWISFCFSIKRTSNRIANTQPKLRTNPPKIANKQNYEQTGVSELLILRCFCIAKACLGFSHPRPYADSSDSLQDFFISLLGIQGLRTFFVTSGFLAGASLGSQHPSPNVKTFCNFEPQIWPEIITSRDAESTCFKGSRTSCDVIIFGIFWPEKITSSDGRFLPIHAPNRGSQIAAFSIRGFGSQGFPAIPQSMNVYFFGSRELNSQLPFSVRKGFALSALFARFSVRNRFRCQFG